METIINDFAVQPVYLAAQIVNFILVLLILKRFLYKPILKVLEDRKTTVADSLINAEKIEQRLLNTQRESEQQLADVKKRAKIIMDKASISADQIIADAHEKVQADIDIMLEKSKQSISIDRKNMQNELRRELADLIVLVTERVAGRILDETDQQIIVDQTISKIPR